ncbi:MAG TPA: class I SAM-dependent RNA methyltransferase [Candidatus Deferrimicrobiaceae bacterium]
MILTALKPAAGGSSLAMVDGMVHFVRGALPGETVEAEITESKKHHRFARATRIVDPSPHRVDAPCPIYGICGGCRLQHSDYPFQVEMKIEVLRDVLRRIGKIDCEGIAAITSEPYGYRARGTFRIDAQGPAFLREASHDLIHLTRCPLMTEGINRVLPALCALPGNLGVDEMRALSNGDETLLAFRDRRFDAETAARLDSAGVAGVRFADRTWGKPSLTFPIGALRYTVGPLSFLQANWRVNLALVDRLVAWCGEAEAEAKGGTNGPVRVLDLYAGAGNFALPVGAAGCNVVAVEGNEASFRDLQQNIVANGLAARCRAVRSPVERFRSSGRYDVVLLDPPRTGLTPAARLLVERTEATRIAFVSCDPATLARDLATLSDRYSIESVTLLDFFPQTHHIETLAFLARRRG